MELTDTIGVGVVTLNRPDMLGVLLRSLPYDRISKVVVVDSSEDGSNESTALKHKLLYINAGKQLGKNLTVGEAKNILFRALQSYDYIFTLEDDIEIYDPSVFEVYINTIKTTGIQHLNYAYHGPTNKKPKATIEYKNGIYLDIFHDLLGAFSVYTKRCLQACPMMDERYVNALEHVEHTLRISNQGMHPPFRWFADIHNSLKYIRDQVPNHERSSIRSNQKEWMMNFDKARALFKAEHGIDVCKPYMEADINTVKQILKECHKKWSE